MKRMHAPVQTGGEENGRFHANRRLAQENVGSVRVEEFSLALLRLAQAAGMRKGLPLEEAQDCGIGFVLHMLADEPLLTQVRGGKTVSSAWMQTCAEHWTANFVRYRRRLYAHEHLTAQMPEAPHLPRDTPKCAADLGLPERQMLRVELRQRLLAATLSLTDSQRDLFRRRYLEESSIEEIARETGRTPGALKQALANLRRRLQTRLIGAGINDAEVAQYLHLLASPTVPAAGKRQHERAG